MTKEDQLLLASIEDKMLQCEAQYIPVHSGFLDSHQVAVVNAYFRTVPGRHLLYGGYDEAERRLALFLPDYLEAEDYINSEDNPLTVLSIKTPKGSKKLTHRDYLGSVLALGLKRDVIGDIIVLEDGADMIIMKDMEDFLLANYGAAGHTSLTLSVKPISQLSFADVNVEHASDTVASLRLDNVVASAFKLSRGRAQEAISAGLVFVNSIEQTKPDSLVEEGDKMVLRGRGKVILKEVGGRSRKDRICINYDRYL